MKKLKLKLRAETVRSLTASDLCDVAGGMIAQSAATDEMGVCCGTGFCNTRADRDCWGTYNGCPG